MRYTLYGQGEGLCANGSHAYVVVQNDIVTDASISALKAGIRIGWNLRTAKSVLPEAEVFQHPSGIPSSMQSICQILWNASPFLRFESENAFFLQVPSHRVPPISEVRSLLLEVDTHLSREQRFRLGFGENPFLAQALVEWSRIERIPNAMYLRVRRQQFLVSPGIAIYLLGNSELQTDWIREMPIKACWFLSETVRKQLHALGVWRLWQLECISSEMLIRHFGKEAQLWKRAMLQVPGTKMQPNYPPDRRNVSWQAPLGEESDIAGVDTLLEHLVSELAQQLQKESVGAMTVGLYWEIDGTFGRFESRSKQPVYLPSMLLAQLRPGRLQMHGRQIGALEVYVTHFQPLQSTQMEFLLHQDTFYPERISERKILHEVWKELLHRFPSQLQWGMKPAFRERRMLVIQEGGITESEGFVHESNDTKTNRGS